MGSLDPVNRAIWNKFHVHHNDTSPITGYEGTRETLAQLFCELGYRYGAEIGVQQGNYSEVLCKNNPELKLHCIDCWAPFSHHDQSWQDRQYERAKEKLKSYNAVLIKKPSLEAVSDYKDGELDFVYIDALHDFDSVMQDIIRWAPRVRRGGIVAGHDYCYYYQCGVIRAIDTYAAAHNIQYLYITPKDSFKSWFFVK